MAHLRRPGIDASLATTQGKKKSRKSRGKPIQELGITDWLRSRRIWCRKWRARGAGAFVVAIGGKRGRRGLLNRRQYCCGRDDGTPQLGHIFCRCLKPLYTEKLLGLFLWARWLLRFFFSGFRRNRALIFSSLLL
jgi:hypothetical protein